MLLPNKVDGSVYGDLGDKRARVYGEIGNLSRWRVCLPFRALLFHRVVEPPRVGLSVVVPNQAGYQVACVATAASDSSSLAPGFFG